MNMNDYPTPRTDAAAETRIVKGKPREIVDADEMRNIERESAAWKAVAEMYWKTSEFDIKDEPRKLERLLFEADRAFDALKAELEQP